MTIARVEENNMNNMLATMSVEEITKRAEKLADVKIAVATVWANKLQRIVEEKKLYKQIGDKKHLLAEAWQTIANLDEASMVPQTVTPIRNKEGDIIGYSARVEIKKGDEIVGAADMPCFLSENLAQGKRGDDKHRAVISAAQTFACAKAGRMKYSWIAVMAGYDPTPAEEMSSSSKADDKEPEDKNAHWCEEHKTNFYKRGQMRGFAHKIEGTDKWCNEPKDNATKPPIEGTATHVNVPAQPRGEPDDIAFVNLAMRKGYKNMADALNQVLKVSSWKEWTELGGDLKGAIAKLEQAQAAK